MDNQQPIELSEQQGTETIFPCEWCFKFDDGESVVFAAANEKIDGQEPAIRLVLHNTEQAKVTFSNEDKTFTIYCRPITEKGQELITQNQPENDRS